MLSQKEIDIINIVEEQYNEKKEVFSKDLKKNYIHRFTIMYDTIKIYMHTGFKTYYISFDAKCTNVDAVNISKKFNNNEIVYFSFSFKSFHYGLLKYDSKFDLKNLNSDLDVEFKRISSKTIEFISVNVSANISVNESVNESVKIRDKVKDKDKEEYRYEFKEKARANEKDYSGVRAESEQRVNGGYNGSVQNNYKQ